MKTIYEERYNKALESAKRELESCGTMDCDAAKQIFRIFPELAESDDERIRKELIEALKQLDREKTPVDSYPYLEWVSWLEKQKTIGESLNISTTEECEKYHKAIDSCLDNKEVINMSQPKFKVGDYVANDDSSVVAQIEGVSTDGIYYTFKIIKPSISYTAPNCEFVDRYYHLWTIEDAKEGDVLSYNDGHGNDCIELIKSITDKKIEFWFCLTNGNRYEVFDGIIPYTNLVSREDATPATKEQRDLLFQKMKEAGYTWDAKKKELI